MKELLITQNLGLNELMSMKNHIERLAIKNVLWQTSNPVLMNKALAYLKKMHMNICFTKNRRYLNDVWGGHTTLSSESGWIGAPNYALGRRSRGIISTKSSMWTWFLQAGKNVSLVLV